MHFIAINLAHAIPSMLQPLYVAEVKSKIAKKKGILQLYRFSWYNYGIIQAPPHDHNYCHTPLWQTDKYTPLSPTTNSHTQ